MATEYSECPFKQGIKCYHDIHKNNCEMFDYRTSGCALRSVVDSIGEYDGACEYVPSTYMYDDEKIKYIDVSADPNFFACLVWNVSTIPPLLERITKALEKIANK